MVLVGCHAHRQQTATEPPVILIHQGADYPIPGRSSEFPCGLIAVFWLDGRIIRCTNSKSVGKAYIEGTVAPQHRDDFLSFLGSAIDHAPTVKGIRMHGAAQSITIHRAKGDREWQRNLPDTVSVWGEVESRLLSLPLQNGHALDSDMAERLAQKK